MAERRMFAKTIIDSDAFLDMPLSTQALYFHLSMRADDEGFINNPKKIQRMVGSSEDDLKLLTAKRFILAFDSGVIVIKHWKLHNYIRSDRSKPTMYLEEKSQLITKENKAYSVGMTVGIPEADHLDTQVRLGKDRLGKVSKDILSSSDEQDDVPYKEIVDYLNLKTSKSYKYSTSKTKSLIKARWNEGFRVDDFKKVVDNKCFEWIGNPDMAKYLRPETLFGTKFEGYLNENNVKQGVTNNFENIDSEWVR